MKKSANVSRGSVLLVLTLWGVSAGVYLRAQSSQSSQLAANAELGQPNFMSSTCDNPALKPSQMVCHPVGVGINNANDLLFVADGDDNRVLIWPNASRFTNAQAAKVILGQPDFIIGRKCSGGTTASTICDPNAATVDADGNLWIADTDGDRILRFSPPFTNDMSANMVIGQRNLTTSICGNDAQTLCAPRDLKFDTFGNLWVADSDNNRVLVFLAPLSNSESASLVIGQPDFTSKHCNRGSAVPAADTLCGPKGLTLDSSGNLWVAEDDKSRVLEYNDPLHAGTSDISASLVYGEPDFSTVACNVGANNVCHPDRVALGRSGQQYFNPLGIHPSLPNYLWLEAGTNFGILNDDPPSVNSQTTTEHLVTLLNNAKISWKAYEEDISVTACPLTDTGEYAVKHDPFVYFDDVTNNQDPNSTYCIAHVRPFTELASDLKNGSVAQYNFITPNLCHDMHDKCKPIENAITQGDTWLSQNVPTILNSAAYKNGGGLFITWDEAASGDGPIGMILLSPFAKGHGYQNFIHYTHGSTLRTFEEIFAVSPLLNDAATETDLSDLFTAFP